jgi:hypothetical protein
MMLRMTRVLTLLLRTSKVIRNVHTSEVLLLAILVHLEYHHLVALLALLLHLSLLALKRRLQLQSNQLLFLYDLPDLPLHQSRVQHPAAVRLSGPLLPQNLNLTPDPAGQGDPRQPARVVQVVQVVRVVRVVPRGAALQEADDKSAISVFKHIGRQKYRQKYRLSIYRSLVVPIIGN